MNRTWPCLADMPYCLFYDTETTGFPLAQPWTHPEQPRIVQLAAVLVDQNTKKQVASMDVIVNPGKPIGAMATEVHGIDEQLAQQFGVTPRVAINLFIQLWRMSDVRIAHNQQFDEKLIAILLTDYAEPDAQIHTDWLRGPSICTMVAATPLTADELGGKWPKLSEACRILIGREIENAHSAMPDVLACIDLYFYCLKHGAIPR